MSVVHKVLRVISGVIPGVDSVAGLVLRRKYYKNKDVLSAEDDEASELYSYQTTNWARNGKRFCEFAAIGFCVAAWLGATLFPIPGLGPITALASMSVLKMLGISVGYILAARTVGAYIGHVLDSLTLNRQRRDIPILASQTSLVLSEGLSSKKTFFFKGIVTSLFMGMFGELGVTTISNLLFGKKDVVPPPNENDQSYDWDKLALVEESTGCITRKIRRNSESDYNNSRIDSSFGGNDDGPEYSSPGTGDGPEYSPPDTDELETVNLRSSQSEDREGSSNSLFTRLSSFKQLINVS